jgi:hypothetical protein
VHGEVLAQTLQLRLVSRAFERDQYADLAQAGGGDGVNIRHNHALADLQHGGTAQRLVLADRGDVVVSFS